MKFDKFTVKAQEAIQAAEQEARQRGQQGLQGAHLLAAEREGGRQVAVVGRGAPGPGAAAAGVVALAMWVWTAQPSLHWEADVLAEEYGPDANSQYAEEWIIRDFFGDRPGTGGRSNCCRTVLAAMERADRQRRRPAR